jgi:hypothetical protein
MHLAFRQGAPPEQERGAHNLASANPEAEAPASGDPRQEYHRRLALRQDALALLRGRDRALSNGRLAVFLAGVGLGVLILLSDWLSPIWLLVPAVTFAVLVVLHDRAIRMRERAAEAVAFYERALGRLDHTWAGAGIQDTDYVAEDHTYAADLDIFGKASLFELICQARTRAGEQTLAAWLAGPAPVEQVLQRQAAVDELRGELDLREDLALLGSGVRSGVRPEVLGRWGAREAAFPGSAAAFHGALAWLLPVAVAAAITAWGLLDAGPLPLIAVGIVLGGARRLARGRVQRVMADIHQPGRELLVVAAVLRRLERETFSAGGLRSLKQRLAAEGGHASRAIRRLDRLVNLADSMKNMFFASIGALLMWDLHLALRIERWRLKNGPRIPLWLEAVGEFEALCSLAGYAYEHPADPFPELAAGDGCFEAEELGHPLIREADCVRNSVSLGGEVRALIVSGSNMSGKSTLLRTVGVNAVLAQAGAPVRARRLRLSPLSLGATIRIQDSLLAGRSRFFEEVKRLKQLMDLAAGERPLLFLLDEVLHGTNSHDRQIGAAALVRQFIDSGAIGLLTTHDLALSRMAERLPGKLDNVHFADRLEDGQLVFDYTLRPGVVQRSNAIALMRSVGLTVSDTPI